MSHSTDPAPGELDMSQNAQLVVRLADYACDKDGAAIVKLLDAYARESAGGGMPLSPYAVEHVVRELAKRPQAFSVLAWCGMEPIGLVNCIEGFSTFACAPLVNVHDVTVIASHRGVGIARLMLLEVEREAKNRGACKLTLEVLSGNVPARQLYERAGFVDYQLDPEWGNACFMQKWLKV